MIIADFDDSKEFDGKYCIYAAINVTTLKIYVGKTKRLRKRIIDHKSNALTSNHRSHFYRSIRKYGFESFLWIVLESNIKNEQVAYAREVDHILFMKSIGIKLLNETNGGCGSVGHVLSPEQRENLSKAMKKYCKSEKSFEKKSGEMRKRWIDGRDDMKNQISKRWKDPDFQSKMKNIHQSDSHKKVLSENAKKQWSSDQFRKKRSERMESVYSSDDFRRKISESIKAKWQDPEYREKMKNRRRKL